MSTGAFPPGRWHSGLMRVGILGPLQVTADDGVAVRIGGARLRALLIRLALDAGGVVTVDALCRALWPPSDEGGPAVPAHALHSLVARLRRALPDGAVLRSPPAGYRLDVPPEAVDARRFENLAARGRDSLRAGRPSEARALLHEAQNLWRGEALADVASRLPFAANAALRLNELRLAALEDRLEADLRAGAAPAPLAAELEELTAAHPYRERLRHLHVQALHADGRHPEALAAYEDYRRFLADELGADPGPRLQDLHLAVLRNETPPAGGLRAPLTSFVGRDRERADVAALLARSRLVTLVGPGGVGKTRLATAVAPGVDPRARLVDLAPVTDPADVPYAVAAALDLHEPGRSPDVLARLAGALAASPRLIILDNCEHVVDAAARLVHELLGRCPDLTVLATGREPLAITGETVYQVPPLTGDPATRLFIDRARDADPGFAPDPRVPGLCRRLDGLPLAIELAAARLRTMTLDRLEERLDDRFRVLTGGSRAAPPRHRTLRGVVAWSWDLLTGTERDAAERLAVFPAPFTPAVAQRAGISLEALDALVDKSLLQVDGARYRMLDTIREYGLERLAETDRLAPSQRAFVACMLSLAEQADPQLRGPGQPLWLERLDAERDNLFGALRLACDSGDTDSAMSLGSVLGLYWTIRGDHMEAVQRLRPVLEMPGADANRTATLAGFLLNACFAGELPQARDFLDEKPVDGPRSGGSPSGQTPSDGPLPDDPVGAHVMALRALATGNIEEGVRALDPHVTHPEPWTRGMTWLLRSFLHGARTGGTAESHRDLLNAIDAYREAGEHWGLSIALASAAFAHSAAGDFDAAAASLEESAALITRLGPDNQQRLWLPMIRIHTGDTARARAELDDVLAATTTPGRLALARLLLADLARHEGDLEEAARHLALAAPEAADDPPTRALYLTSLGLLDTARGDLPAAGQHLREALALATTMPDMPMVASVAVGLARTLHAQGDNGRAAELLGAAHALRGGPDTRHPDVHALARALEGRMGATAYEAAYTDGRTHPDPYALVTASAP